MFDNKRLANLESQVRELQVTLDTAVTLIKVLNERVNATAEDVRLSRLSNELMVGHTEEVVVRTETRLCRLMEHMKTPPALLGKPIQARRVS
jgi:predicted  nucleic acid-binding Zn-ribbon protein